MLNEVCLPLGMPKHEMERLDDLVKERIRIPKGGALFRLADPVEGIYGLRSGSIKMQLEDSTGHIQITGFLLPGEILGMDSLVENRHVSHAIALEDIEAKFDSIPKDRPVALVCNTGLRSYEVMLYLHNHGVTDVVNALGGMQALIKRGDNM